MIRHNTLRNWIVSSCSQKLKLRKKYFFKYIRVSMRNLGCVSNKNCLHISSQSWILCQTVLSFRLVEDSRLQYLKVQASDWLSAWSLCIWWHFMCMFDIYKNYRISVTMWYFTAILLQYIRTVTWGWIGRSGALGGRSPGCFFSVLPKRNIPKPDRHRKDIQQKSLCTDML